MLDKSKKSILFGILGIILVIGVYESKIIHKIIYPKKYYEYVSKYSSEFSVDENLVYSIMKAESKFIEDAESYKGAKGLMQISDITRDWGASELDIDDIDIFNPEDNIKIGCWYINKLFKEFGKLDLVIAAYNGGSGNVSKWLKNKEYSLDGVNLYKIPFEETSNYVKKVLKNYKNYNEIYSEKGNSQ